MFVSDVHDVAGQKITVETCTVVHLKSHFCVGRDYLKVLKRITVKKSPVSVQYDVTCIAINFVAVYF
jgi:hypothetical protein